MAKERITPMTLLRRLLLFFNWRPKQTSGGAQGRRVVRTNDASFNAKFGYRNNRIKTSRYTWYTFLPLNIFEQFMRVANCYFLLLVILQSIPTITPIPAQAQGLGLACVLLLTSIKYAADDIFRHRSDKRINNRQTKVLQRDAESSVTLKTVTWKEVTVGQIISLENNEDVPADMVLLSSSEGSGLCYIETAELDGENNLKYRLSLEKTQAHLGNDLKELGDFNAEVECELPNNNLTRFDGRLLWHGEKYSLNNDNVLLRGCCVRNTRWAFGLVIYAGQESKLMKNAGKSAIKRTRIEQMTNKLFTSTFVIMAIFIITAAIMGYLFESGTGEIFKTSYSLWMTLPANKEPNASIIAVIQMWSHLILINALLPISLYISAEFVQLMLSRGFINGDLGMYHAQTDTPAEARTTTLCEDLGQIEYIFSDKTGTLTRNIMTFNKCSISGIMFGHCKDGELSTNLVDFSQHEPRYYEPSFRFYDGRLLQEVQSGQHKAQVHEFFLLIALCHTVNAEIDEKDGQLAYKAQSPDEAALVGAARNFGFVYKSRTQSSITIECLGSEITYQLLCTLEFDNIRKRMSVIVRDKDGRRQLLCKGADATVLPIITNSNSPEAKATVQHLGEFASEGLRTLCCAVKDISENEWADWSARYKVASTSLEDRQGKLLECYQEIEQNLTLIGATAVEDKLQDGVPETISKLREAGIKIWVLTGDKQETAINIGYSCNILNNGTRELIVDADNLQDVEQQLLSLKQLVCESNDKGTSSEPSTVEISLHEIIGPTKRDKVLIINGHSLFHALTKELEDLFLEVACACQAVICCRVTPLQKGQVVSLVKRKTNSLTLAIGDGANDVNMIKTAHIGVGISGQEGRQAVLASDFSFAQFRFLQRLLLYHGRQAYFRVAGFMRLFFYKTFSFSPSQIWFAIYCGWSAMSLFDQWYITSYNMFYTATPVLYYALFEQDVNAEYSLKYPKLYQPGLRNQFFNWRTFLLAEFEGLCTSVASFFIMRYGYGDMFTDTGNAITASRAAMGIAVGTVTGIVVSIRQSLEVSHWTPVNLSPVFSIGSLFAVQYLFSVILAAMKTEFENYGVVTAVWSSPCFWLCCFACIAICCLPVIFVRSLLVIFKPSLVYRIRIRHAIPDRSGNSV